jgi:hypothetical protein
MAARISLPENICKIQFQEQCLPATYTAFSLAVPVGDSTYKEKWEKSLFPCCAYHIKTLYVDDTFNPLKPKLM